MACARRPAADVLDPRVKSLDHLNNALARLEAPRNAALLLNARGLVAGASALFYSVAPTNAESPFQPRFCVARLAFETCSSLTPMR